MPPPNEKALPGPPVEGAIGNDDAFCCIGVAVGVGIPLCIALLNGIGVRLD